MSTLKETKFQKIFKSLFYPDYDYKITENYIKFFEEHEIIKQGERSKKILYKLNCDFYRHPINKNENELFKYCIYYDNHRCDHLRIFKTKEDKTIIVLNPYIYNSNLSQDTEYYTIRGYKQIDSLYVTECYSFMCVV